jgi:hypothetical protein
MCMLGNFSCGLSPKNKRTLYGLCYFYCNIQLLTPVLQQQQIQAGCQDPHQDAATSCCVNTGVFCTSLTGGIEALVCLLPISPILKKMSSGSITQVVLLSDTHLMCSLMSRHYLKHITLHTLSISLMTPAIRAKVTGSLMQADNILPLAIEVVEPFHKLHLLQYQLPCSISLWLFPGQRTYPCMLPSAAKTYALCPALCCWIGALSGSKPYCICLLQTGAKNRMIVMGSGPKLPKVDSPDNQGGRQVLPDSPW